MSIHFLMTTGAAVLLVAGPALADCNEEIQSLKEAVIQAETGASSTDSGFPATPHQEQVLAGEQQGDKGGAVVGQADVPVSPHQRQVLTEPAAGGGGASASQVADLVAEADDMAEAGNEEDCMQKLTQAKDLLGLD